MNRPLENAGCRGFTLIELLMAAAVTAIMIAVVASAYRTHSVRAQVVAGIDSAGPAKQLIADAFRLTGEIPPDNSWPAERGSPPAPQAVIASGAIASVAITGGRIDVAYGDGADPAIAGRVLALTPYETADLRVVWLCGNQIPDAGLQPLGFARGGPQPVQISTTIERRFLPPTCR